MLTRLLDQDRPPVAFTVDGLPAEARRGDTLLTAILADGMGHLRESEFGDGKRAGFCWMGACQDCWVVVEGLSVARACTTLVEPGMRATRTPPARGRAPSRPSRGCRRRSR